MKIASLQENKKIEKRIAITPEITKKYVSNGFEVFLSKNYGQHLGFSDDEYDFAVMTHWYNRDYRADSVKSYGKMTTLFREKGIFDGYREHVEGCERTPRVYASEWLYSTISD